MEVTCTTCYEDIDISDKCACERADREKLPKCKKCKKAIFHYYINPMKKYLYCQCGIDK